ncbi:SDR family oxidoreductase [Sphingobium sp. V4]|uniref:SDR family NAD(P)-dependent oxidoreductase n=1 Tax=Sphingobium sp. V4 TaxID=3038927 RepID=UPI002557E0BC|nr:SDR family NAD(P)-dependent oxidoreductase [Sphingobium sp. V4]WIW89511.1 SDR family oxidoreductase [Sphingobium sp. V4]
MDVSSLFGISDKMALVTGGTAGIGEMIAEGLASAGAKVWICGRKQEQLDAATRALSKFGEVHAIRADVSTDEGIAELVAQLAPLGKLDILVNNAGTSVEHPLGSFPRSSFESVVDLNLTAPFMLTQALLPLLKASATPEDPARVVNIASLVGMRAGSIPHFSYSSSKAGLLMLTEHLARALAQDNISVNAVSPGYFPSKLTADSLSDPDFLAAVASPFLARVGTPEDIAGAVIFFCSRAGAWNTGINIPVSGGRKVIDS